MMNHIFDRVFVVLGAFLFSLFPSFVQQYQHQLIGHVDELRWQVHGMEKNAAKTGKNLDQYIKKFTDHPDKDFSNQGIVMSRTLARWNTLSTALTKLQQATLLTRPFIFVFYLQWDVFKSTAAGFQPGITITSEGAFYILLGMVAGYLFFQLLRHVSRKIFRGKSDRLMKVNHP